MRKKQTAPRSRGIGLLICVLLLFGACPNPTGDDGGKSTVPVTGVTVTPANPQLVMGETVQLQAAVTPDTATNKTITWASSAPSVADVGATGLVTAYTAGTAVITAASADGPSGTTTVTVLPVPVTKVLLNTAETYIVVNGTEQLTAVVEPSHAEQGVTWTSGDEGVATVSAAGLVTAQSVGNAVITAASVSDPTKTAVCTVHVEAAPVTIIGLSLGAGPVNLIKGGQELLSVTYSPANTTDRGITWSSSNTNVVTVSNGLVRAVGGGSATITATSTANSGVVATCTVSVTVPVSGVSLDYTTLDLLRGETGTLTATVSPSDATNQALTWSSSAPTVVSVTGTGNSVTLNALGAGTAVITAISVADPAKTASCTVAVNVQGIEIVFIGFEDETITLTTEVDQGTNLNVTAPAGFDRYLWYWDGNFYSLTTTPTYNFYSPAPGRHYITVIVEEGDYHFSKTLIYTVGY
jgi:uncharacterized protein YjdB